MTTLAIVTPKDPTAAARSRRYRSNKKAAAAAPIAPSVTVDTIYMAGLAGKLSAGTVTPADREMAARLLLAFAMSLPADSAIEI